MDVRAIYPVADVGSAMIAAQLAGKRRRGVSGRIRKLAKLRFRFDR
jgi:hypothetical protein